MYKRPAFMIIGSLLTMCLLVIVILISPIGYKMDVPGATVPEPPKSEETPKKTAEREKQEVIIDYPQSSRSNYADVRVVNDEGREYNYRLFKQTAGYSSYSDYLSAHGCSTCALTTLIRNVDTFEDITPNEVIEEVIPYVSGASVFDKNFSKSPSKQMPITLYGMRKICDEFGIEYKLPSNDAGEREAEITEWLGTGNPVLFTFGNGEAASMSAGTHTVILLGVDDTGYVVIGDSLHKSKNYWGSQGLVKAGKLTVSDLLSFIKNDGPWTVQDINSGDSHFFYKNPSDRGYLMVKL